MKNLIICTLMLISLMFGGSYLAPASQPGEGRVVGRITEVYMWGDKLAVVVRWDSNRNGRIDDPGAAFDCDVVASFLYDSWPNGAIERLNLAKTNGTVMDLKWELIPHRPLIRNLREVLSYVPYPSNEPLPGKPFETYFGPPTILP